MRGGILLPPLCGGFSTIQEACLHRDLGCTLEDETHNTFGLLINAVNF
nr:MAG TPA: hypothetical protein [Caudoviricetes sp.]